MRILAIETTEPTGSVAALEDARLVAEVTLVALQRSAQALAPALVELLSHVRWQAADVQLIAVTAGPGSFTGLRVGVTTAKTLAYATGAEVLGVNTLEVIAAQAPPSEATVTAVIDAQRGQLYSATYQPRRGKPHEIAMMNCDLETQIETHIVDRDLWLAERQAGEVVTGPGLSRLIDDLPPEVTVVATQDWAPRASTVGKLAFAQYQSGRRDDLFRLAPRYYRLSAAEEKWNERQEGRAADQ